MAARRGEPRQGAAGAGEAAADTPTRILDAAERLFAARGFEGTSLRALTRAAGANLAAVSYHFGSKEGLLQAVLARRVAPMWNAARLAELEALEAGPRPPELRQLLRAFVGPAILQMGDPCEGGPDVLRFLGVVHAAPQDLVQGMMGELFGEVATRFQAALRRALPHLEPAEVGFRMMALVGMMTFVLAHQGRPPGPVPLPALAPPGLVDHLVAMAAPGFEAPPAQG